MLSNKAKRELKIDQRQILIDSIEIGIPSPQQICLWGSRQLPNGKKVGLVKNSKTVNYKRFTPFRDGLFCERIFGPVTSFVCACGKKQPHSKITFCEKCEVEYIDQRSRRYRLGYISLLSPVTHIWYLKGRPSYLSLFLGKRKKTVVALAYCNAYLIERSPLKKEKESARMCNEEHIWPFMKPLSNTKNLLQNNFYKASFGAADDNYSSTKSLISSDINFAPAHNQKARSHVRTFAHSCRAHLCLTNRRFVLPSTFVSASQIPSAERVRRFVRTQSNPFLSIYKENDRNQAKRYIPPCNKNALSLGDTFPFKGKPANAKVNKTGHIESAKINSASNKSEICMYYGRSINGASINETLQAQDERASFYSYGAKGSTKKICTTALAAKEESNLFKGIEKGPKNLHKENLNVLTSYGTYSYIRQQTLPFLPTFVSHFYLRDALLNFIYSSPADGDIPLMEYCQNKRREPLQDVHKLMAHQSVDSFKNDLMYVRSLPRLKKTFCTSNVPSISALISANKFGTFVSASQISSTRHERANVPSICTRHEGARHSESTKLKRTCERALKLKKICKNFAPMCRGCKPTGVNFKSQQRCIASSYKSLIYSRSIDKRCFKNSCNLYGSFSSKKGVLKHPERCTFMLRHQDKDNFVPCRSSETIIDQKLRPYKASQYRFINPDIKYISWLYRAELYNSNNSIVKSRPGRYFGFVNKTCPNFSKLLSKKVTLFQQGERKVRPKFSDSFRDKPKRFVKHQECKFGTNVPKCILKAGLLFRESKVRKQSFNKGSEFGTSQIFDLCNVHKFLYKLSRLNARSNWISASADPLTNVPNLYAEIHKRKFKSRVATQIKHSNARHSVLGICEAETKVQMCEGAKSQNLKNIKVNEENNPELLSHLELTTIREILSYTGGGALQQLLQQFDQHDLCKFLFAEKQILRVLYQKHNTNFIDLFSKSAHSCKESGSIEKQYISSGLQAMHSESAKLKRVSERAKLGYKLRKGNETSKRVDLRTGKSLIPPLRKSTKQNCSFSVKPTLGSVSKISDSIYPNQSEVQRNSLQIKGASARSHVRFGFADSECQVPNLYGGFTTEAFAEVQNEADKVGFSIDLFSSDKVNKEKITNTVFDISALQTQLCNFSESASLKAEITKVPGTFVSNSYKLKFQTLMKFVEEAKKSDLQKKQLIRASRRIYKVARRLKVTQLLTLNHRRPEWMILSHLPVLPPDLRPILQMSEKVIVASDLNIMYQRVIYRNNRHLRVRFIDFHLVTAIQRLVQDAVDRLMENGKGGSKPYYTQGGRPLKSLSDILKGKKGRFRLNLLGKRVDFSGRSVIVVAPSLKIHECGLPKDIALELYHYFLLRQLIVKKVCTSIVTAKKMIKSKSSLMWNLLRELMYHHPVLLNRAPTLHRLGIQAFQPKLVIGNAIWLHPLVCSGFNADFDGDQMGVHLPLSFASRAESWDLLWSRNNLLSPATGQPMLVPSQDMVLGFYYMTASAQNFPRKPFHDRSVQLQDRTIETHSENSSQSSRNNSVGSGMVVAPLNVSQTDNQALLWKNLYGSELFSAKVAIQKKLQNKNSLFANTKSIITNLQNNLIKLHTPIWLHWDGKLENENSSQIPLELRVDSFGLQRYIYKKHITSSFFTKTKVSKHLRAESESVLTSSLTPLTSKMHPFSFTNPRFVQAEINPSALGICEAETNVLCNQPLVENSAHSKPQEGCKSRILQKTPPLARTWQQCHEFQAKLQSPAPLQTLFDQKSSLGIRFFFYSRSSNLTKKDHSNTSPIIEPAKKVFSYFICAESKTYYIRTTAGRVFMNHLLKV